MITVTWPNGSRSRGADATDVLEQARANPWNAIYSELGFRQALRRRAFAYAGVHIQPLLSDERLLEELAEAGVLKDVTWTPDGAS